MSCFSAHSLSPLQLLELIAKSQLPALSGVAQKNYMNILERVVQKGELRQSFFFAKSHPATLFQSLFCARGPSSHIVRHTQAPLLVHYLQLILLCFAIVCEMEHVGEVGMKLCGSPVCADK